ncbi:hypothetical protein [Achromobacter insuavis]|uniref:hypothetical protein n=1 Tax=Achromobacter insuavis TaxID=1287735 RepID=UPI001FD4068C|nr:hypothetical protein [Achromobacter insuavis]
MSIVSAALAAEVQSEVDRLRHAVEVGDMDAVDAATARLLTLTVDCQSVDLSEAEWRAFTNDIRTRLPAFESNYLLPDALCASLFPTIGASEQVLELPIDGDTDEDEIGV